MKIYAQTRQHTFEFDAVDDKKQIIYEGDKQHRFDVRSLGNGRYAVIINNRSYIVQMVMRNGAYQVYLAGHYVPVSAIDEHERRLRELIREQKSGPTEEVLKAPIPGMVVTVDAEQGQRVKSGQTLLVLEAMKMENVIKAPCDCEVSVIKVKAGQSVHQNQELVALKKYD